MQFFASAVTTLQTLVVALGAGLAVWGVVNLLEGYGSDNAAAKSPVSYTHLNRAYTNISINIRYVSKTLINKCF